jgi:hypothetical protein
MPCFAYKGIAWVVDPTSYVHPLTSLHSHQGAIPKDLHLPDRLVPWDTASNSEIGISF